MEEHLAKNKRQLQLQYKDMLDRQMEVQNQFKMYGNMSSIEKALNKSDLQAYKNYDNKQYSLVPGIQHAKHIQMADISKSHDSPIGGSPRKMDPESRYY